MPNLRARFALRFIGLCAALMLLMALPQPARAVIVLGGRDVNGTLDNSGRNLNSAPSNLSNYVGSWGAYLGTPIAPRYFITANHIGDGGGGGSFVYFNGTVNSTTYSATLAGVQNDLAIWKISNSDPAFSLYAPLYSGSNELGQALVTIGRGTPRGSPVINPNTSQQVGWNWASGDQKTSWGSNTVSVVGPATNPPAGFGGDMVQFAFNFDATKPDTGILSDGDSGGPTFVLNPSNSQYQLAGINSLVDQVSDQPDTMTNPTHLMRAALYDSRGFWDGPNQVGGAQSVPLVSYASRISSASSFIDSVIVPEPGTELMMALAIGGVLLRRRRG